jgi:orc1/cdc6 family replication initiation protein
MTVIEDATPLQQDYLPEKFVDREYEKQLLSGHLTQNLHIHGPRGTGKTHFTKKALKEIEVNTCYISCIEHDTEYKALRQIISQLTNEQIESGHHTSELQRRVKDHVEVMDTVIVLDELDFLLLKGGEDLLYFLSRLPNQPTIVLITANTEDLRERLEPRTHSSLQPHRIQIEPYTGKEIYEILSDRASKSLQPRSVHRNAVTYIASTTQNAEMALTWLRIAAQHADDTVTEELVQEVQEDAVERYAEDKLRYLSQQHRYLYQSVVELSEEKGPVVNAGDIYQRYRTIASEQDDTVLSDRRISDYLKQLELLNLISAEYHYGGKKGKTREVRLENLQ